MLLAGISTERLRGLGVDAHCFIDDPVVAQTALRHGITRSAAAMDRALPLLEQGIVVIGNAPTALLRVLEFMEKGAVHPALVIGLPVGFVSAPEAKEALIRMDFPYITTLGPKGGSAVAASTVNALAIMALEEEGPCQGG
jgi:precorrin-8X/cobalt-precorrin-8 methylmutase